MFLLFVPCQAVISDCLAAKNFCEKLTWTLDKVPPAGPGCQAGRILEDSMISHGNEHKARHTCFELYDFEAWAPSKQASAISLTTLSLSQSQAVKFLQRHHSPFSSLNCSTFAAVCTSSAGGKLRLLVHRYRAISS